MLITQWASRSYTRQRGILPTVDKAIHFLNELTESRCHDFKEFCWGYPFDWVWRGGVIKQQTPLITTTPYGYEAFLQVYELDPRDEWRRILESIARHGSTDIKDFEISEMTSSCSYTPFDEGGVINAAAYRAFLLTRASQAFSNDDYWKIAERNLNFVLKAQNSDGSWFYAVDGVRDFVDHYHTCFVMKALAKDSHADWSQSVYDALAKGVDYYLNNLFAADGLPKPFSKAPRLTVYKRELYDCAECINLCLLASRSVSATCKRHCETVTEGILQRLDQARRFIPFTSPSSWLGQCPDASVGAVADVSKSRLLPRRSDENTWQERSDVRCQRSESGSRKLKNRIHP